MIYQRVADICFISLLSRLIRHQADNPADIALPDITPPPDILYLRILEARASVALVFNQANPHRQHSLPHSCRAARHATRASRARAVSRTRSEFALRWCAGSFGQAHILNTNKRSTCIAMQALEAGQVRLASAPAATFTTRVRAHLLVLDARGVRRGAGVGPAFMSKEISAAHDT